MTYQKGNIPWSKLNRGKYKMPEGTGEKISKALKGRPNPNRGKHIIHSGSFKKGFIPWNKGKEMFEIRGEKSIHWKGGKPNCKECGKQLTNYGSKICHKCRMKNVSGKNALNWKGGIRKIKNERNDSAYQLWVSRVKKRDNNQCLFKSQNCSGYCIVHHILSWRDYPELRYEIKNGITLCQFHHPRKRIDEQKLIPFFREMILTKELI